MSTTHDRLEGLDALRARYLAGELTEREFWGMLAEYALQSYSEAFQ